MSSKSFEVSQILWGRWLNTMPSGTPWPESGFQKKLGWTNYLVGGDTPGWRERVKRHESATNGMSGSIQNIDFHPGQASYSYKRGTDDEFNYSVSGAIVANHDKAAWLSFDVDQVVEVKSVADIRFINRYNSLRSAFESGVFTGEIRETLNALRHPLKSFRSSMSEYLERSRKLKRSYGTNTGRRSRVNNAARSEEGAKRRLLGALGDSYLEFRFGIRPILGDINNIAKALNRPLETYETFSASAEKEFKDTSHWGSRTFGGTAWVLTSDDDLTAYEAKCVGQIAHHNGATARSMENFGVMPERFVPTLYELLPYSWLADYFTNLGDIVSAACVNFGDLAWFSRTQRRYGVRTRLGQFRALNLNFTLMGSTPTRMVWFNKKVDRDAVRPTVPKFSFTTPHGLAKYLDAGFVAQNRALDRQPLGRASRNAYRY